MYPSLELGLLLPTSESEVSVVYICLRSSVLAQGLWLQSLC